MLKDTPGNAIREGGYKLTPQRKAVLGVIAASHDHLTTADIYARVKKKYPTIGLVTVYRTLELLEDLDLICRVHSEATCRSYLLRRSAVSHHHHIMCVSCHKTVDFTRCDLSELQRRLAQETGFQIQDHLLQFQGLCQECRGRQGEEKG